MTTLAEASPIKSKVGDYTDLPIVATDIVYQGAAVGTLSGYARPLVAGDRFHGFSQGTVDNATGSAGDKQVRVTVRGAIELTISGLVATDLRQPVYASDDATFSLSPVGGTFIGFVERFVSSGVGVVAYDTAWPDPWAGFTAEAVSAAKTLDAEDTAKLFVITADAGVITLPAVAGMMFAFVNGGADGTVLITISPNANDGIKGPDLSSADDKDLLNTKATAKRGDYVLLSYGDGTGWIVTRKRGTWAKQA